MGLITSVEEARRLLGRGNDTWETAGVGSQSVTGTGNFYKSGEDFQTVLREKASGISGAAAGLDSIFEDAASTYQIPSRLLKAVAKAESDFDTKAVSRSGAMGVMQLMPGTAKSLGVSDPFDARQNIMGGAKYLKENLDRFKDVKLALAAYNAGPNNVAKYGGVPPFKETQNYVAKIMSDLGTDFSISSESGGSASDSLLASLAGLGMNSSKIGELLSDSDDDDKDSDSLDLTALGSSLLSSGLLGSGASGLSGTDLSGLSGLALNGLLGSSLTGSDSLESSLSSSSSRLSSISAIVSLLQNGASLSEDGGSVVIDKDSFKNLVELVRVQMMMNSESQVGIL